MAEAQKETIYVSDSLLLAPAVVPPFQRSGAGGRSMNLASATRLLS